MTLPHVSPSQIKTFRACASRWHWEKIQGHTQPPSAAMVRGTRIHAMIEAYLVHGAPIPPGDDGDIARAALPLLPGPGSVPREHAEHSFLLPAAHFGVPVKGTIDWIAGGGELVDFKTSSDPKRYGLTSEELQQDPQAQIYAFEAFDGSRDRVSFRHLYLKTSKPYTASYGPPAVFDIQAINEAFEAVRETVQEMQAAAEQPIQEVAYDLTRCGDYGGCPHRGRCAGIGRPTAGVASGLFHLANTQEDQPMNPELFAAMNQRSAAAPAPLPAPAPAPAPLPAPAPAPAPLPAPAPAPIHIPTPPAAKETPKITFGAADLAAHTVITGDDDTFNTTQTFEAVFRSAEMVGNRQVTEFALDTLEGDLRRLGAPLEVRVYRQPGETSVVYHNAPNPRSWRATSTTVVFAADPINPPDARPLAEMPTSPTAPEHKAKAKEPSTRALRLPGVDGGDGMDILLTRASKDQLVTFAAAHGLDVRPVGNRSKPGAVEYRDAISQYLVSGPATPAAAPAETPAAPLSLPVAPLPPPTIERAEVALAVQGAELEAILIPLPPPTIERSDVTLAAPGAEIEANLTPQPAPTPEKEPLVIYVGCAPRSGYTLLEDVLSPLAAEVAADAGVSYYLLIPFNEGPKRVASLLSQRLRKGQLELGGALVADPRQPATDAALEVLIPMASDVVRRF